MSTYYYQSAFQRPAARPRSPSANSPYAYGGNSPIYAPKPPPKPPVNTTPPFPSSQPYYNDPIPASVLEPYGIGQQPAPAPAEARPAIDFSHLDYSNDPILGRIRALAEESMSQAQADATAARTRLVIGLGDPELAEKLKLSGKTVSQARDNPFGTFQELQRTLGRRNVGITSDLSDRRNLFYSTERGKQLALSGEQHLRDRAQATSAAQGQLATIASQVTQARLASQAQIIQAEQEAYARALQMALYGAGVG